MMSSEGNASANVFPYSAFSEEVCRLDLSTLDPLQEGILNYAFYLFNARNKYRRYAGDVMHAIEGFDSFRDYNLPRDRYYAVCSKHQRQNVALCYELKAYTNTEEVGPFALLNASQKGIKEQFRVSPRADALFTLLNEFQLGELTQGLALRSLPNHARTSTEVDEREAEIAHKMKPAIERSSHRIDTISFSGCLVYFPLVRKRLNTTRCIDLRNPDVRRWFFQRYRRGIRGWPGYGYDAAQAAITRQDEAGVIQRHSGFLQMLPALCNLELGGRLMTQVIGADLRRNDVEFLVFPSARCDFFAEFRDATLVDSYGWNLVDYREANSPKSPSEEGVVYTPVHDLVLDEQGRFKEMSVPNIRKQEEVKAQVAQVKLATGRKPRAFVVDINNPWVPPTTNPIGAFRTGAEKYLDPEGWEWPVGKFEITLVEGGQQRGSIAIEGVQNAFDEKEAEQARKYLQQQGAI